MPSNQLGLKDFEYGSRDYRMICINRVDFYITCKAKFVCDETIAKHLL